MRFVQLMVVIGAVGIAVSAVAAAPDAKPGLWERTVTRQMDGAPMSPVADPSKLTLEQRARIEQMMSMRGATAPTTSVLRYCVTAEAARQWDSFSREDGDEAKCERTVQDDSPRATQGIARVRRRREGDGRVHGRRARSHPRDDHLGSAGPEWAAHDDDRDGQPLAVSRLRHGEGGRAAARQGLTLPRRPRRSRRGLRSAIGKRYAELSAVAAARDCSLPLPSAGPGGRSRRYFPRPPDLPRGAMRITGIATGLRPCGPRGACGDVGAFGARPLKLPPLPFVISTPP